MEALAVFLQSVLQLVDRHKTPLARLPGASPRYTTAR